MSAWAKGLSPPEASDQLKGTRPVERGRAALLDGRVLSSRYTVIGQLRGQGIEVVDDLSGQRLLLKVLSAAMTRPQRHAFEMLRQVRHRGLRRIEEVGRDGNLRFTISRHLNDHNECSGPMRAWALQASAAQVLEALTHVVEAVAHLHVQGICHGNIRLTSLRVFPSGTAVLCDLSGAELMSSARLREQCTQDRRQLREAIAHLGECAVLPQTLREWLERTGPAPSMPELLLAVNARKPHHGSSLRWRTVGRASELFQIQRLLDDICAEQEALCSEARVIWISGSHGSGRSQLLREIRWRAQEQCEVVDTSSSVNIAAIVAGSLGEESSRPLGAKQAARLWGEKSPRVILMDDAQDCDRDALEDLFDFARELPASGRGALICCSTQPPPNGMPCVHLELAPLDEPALVQWLGELGMGRAQARVIHRASRGNPAIAKALALACEMASLTMERLQSAEEEYGAGSSSLALCGISDSERILLLRVVLIDASSGWLVPPVLEHLQHAEESLLRRGILRDDENGVGLAPLFSRPQVLQYLLSDMEVPPCRDHGSAQEMHEDLLLLRSSILAQSEHCEISQRARETCISKAQRLLRGRESVSEEREAVLNRAESLHESREISLCKRAAKISEQDQAMSQREEQVERVAAQQRKGLASIERRSQAIEEEERVLHARSVELSRSEDANTAERHALEELAEGLRAREDLQDRRIQDNSESCLGEVYTGLSEAEQLLVLGNEDAAVAQRTRKDTRNHSCTKVAPPLGTCRSSPEEHRAASSGDSISSVSGSSRLKKLTSNLIDASLLESHVLYRQGAPMTPDTQDLAVSLKTAVHQAMLRAMWNPTQAAAALGITRASLYALLRQMTVSRSMKLR